MALKRRLLSSRVQIKKESYFKKKDYFIYELCFFKTSRFLHMSFLFSVYIRVEDLYSIQRILKPHVGKSESTCMYVRSRVFV